MSQLLSSVLFLTMLLTTSATSALTMRAELTHADSGRGFTRWELASRMVAHSRARAASLRHRGGAGNYGQHPATAPVAPGTVRHADTEYLIHFGIGTTPRPHQVALTLDTGSDLVWTQCKPCLRCFAQPSPLFDPYASKTLYKRPVHGPQLRKRHQHRVLHRKPCVLVRLRVW
ncbi:hypothetical protein PR202_ga17803 [Eleusine coracana subsp. coracana]|uniref:Peptidase A1 domain-containing protein n=1 Tax=Eleusine coracana subsp. coracana TaxID=191504 RepID=A0AAV5CRZ4_ELECO|nr:hypothetical protein PR202_ga17803 [Eleusine coracana subsp. coracana]